MDTETQEIEFTIDGDELCLDFANTIGSRGEAINEKLTSYARLVAWAQQAQLIDGAEARRLLDEAERKPDEARAVLEDAIRLREAIYSIFSALSRHAEAPVIDVELLNSFLPRALSHLRLMQEGHAFTWSWHADPHALDMMLWRVVHSAASLLTSERLERVTECGASPDCTWLFVDNSRNRSRRWCDMNDCGNRAKARRHYARSRAHKA